MSVEQDAEEKLESLIQRAAKEGKVIPFRRKTEAKPQPAPTVTVSGHGNAAVIGSNNQVSINVTHTTRKVIANVKPGAVHITDRQAATLKEMVADICKKSGKTHQFVWNQLLRHMVVPQYRLIPAGAYPEALAYLERWLGRHSAADHAGDDAWATRKRHLAYIKINQKKKGIPDSVINDFVHQCISKGTLSECTNRELEYVRALVKTWTQQ